MSSRGFLIYAKGDLYVKQAYLCALSIVANKNKYPVSIVTPDDVPEDYKHIFDKVIPVPWYEETDSRFQTEHRWKLYHASPYDQTIVLDSDVIVLEDIEYFWKFVDSFDFYYPTNVFTYRNTPVTNNYYRKTFVANNLPNVYNTLHYFKKTNKSKLYFTCLETITKNWQLFYTIFCKEYYPKQPSMDVTCAIAMILTDTIQPTHMQTLPSITHMKAKIQEWQVAPEDWRDNAEVYFTDDLVLTVGNFRQNGIFHYTEDTFDVDRFIPFLENAV